jgi:hypothetical protein
MSDDRLYVIARKVTDDVSGVGSYARANAGNRDPRVREQVIASMRAEAVAACRALGCTCEPEPKMTPTPPVGSHALPAWVSDHADDCPIKRLVR